MLGGRWLGNSGECFLGDGTNSVGLAARVVVIELDDLVAVVEQAPGIDGIIC